MLFVLKGIQRDIPHLPSQQNCIISFGNDGMKNWHCLMETISHVK